MSYSKEERKEIANKVYEELKNVCEIINEEELAQCNVYCDGTDYIFDLALTDYADTCDSEFIEKVLDDHKTGKLDFFDLRAEFKELDDFFTILHAKSLIAAMRVYGQDDFYLDADDRESIRSALNITDAELDEMLA